MSVRTRREEPQISIDDPGGRCEARNGSSLERPLLARLSSLISDILRTRICIPGSVFFVEQIDVRIRAAALVPAKVGRRRSRRRIVRLLLSDGGGLCIQAVLHPAGHGLVDSGVAQEGCLVRLDDFRLRVLRHGSSQGRRPTVFVVVDGMSVVDLPGTPLVTTAAESKVDLLHEAQVDVHGDQTSSQESVSAAHKQDISALGHLAARHTVHVQDDLASAPSHGAVRQLKTGEVKAQQGRKSQSREAGPGAGQASGAGTGAPPAWTSDDLTKPLKLTVLRSIPLLPYKQNWKVNVLAVVAQLSEVEPAHLPPYTQRTARLADPSTGKRVLLTVFLDPEAFTPRVGAVVLLLGVKNHQFDGGSLKKYVSDRPLAGRPWWLEAPRQLSWCDVEGLEAWWASRSTQDY